MLIAADVGGTNTRLGLFERATPRPRSVAVREYSSPAFSSFGEILSLFISEIGRPVIDAAGVGVAGPIVRQRARLTNLPWEVSAEAIAGQLGASQVRLLNDLEAMAWSIEVLHPDELHALQPGHRNPDGNAVVLAAGTGLGEAYLPRIDGRVRVLASEAGHADFAARTDREIELVRMLRDTCGRASVEHVLSGPGFLHLHRFTHRQRPCAVVQDLGVDDASARVSRAGLEGSCGRCGEALSMFVEALGAEAGNLGLRGTASAGVYIGGGIGPRILPALEDQAFLRAFRDKAPMEALVSRMPVHVILNRDAGLLGAAVVAAALGR
jgi:glucokinase